MKRGSLLAVVAAALALAGCGGSSTTGTTTTTAPFSTASTTTVATTTEATTTTAGPTDIRIDVKGGKPVGGLARATVKRGDDVVLVVHSDVADEVHLHGYDKHVDVAAGGTARLAFTADIAGQFEAELENSKLQILALTVQ